MGLLEAWTAVHIFTIGKVKHASRVLRTKRMLLSAGIELHEEQDSGTGFNGLDWDFALGADSSRAVWWLTACAFAKYKFLMGFLEAWTAVHTDSMSLFDIRRACGLLLFFSAGYPLIKTCVGLL